MRILLLNQFVPPEQPPTARLAGDLAEALKAAGHEVRGVGASSGYGAVGGVRRILRDLRAHAKIAWRVLAGGPCDWILCLSDPTGLPLTARVLAALKGARLAHWAMDVYPQVALALGALQPGFISALVGQAMRTAYRGCDLLVALDADMADELQRVSGCRAAVLPPWPPPLASSSVAPQPGHASPSSSVAPQPSHSDQPRRWLYSGNLGRAHDFETLLEAQKILERDGHGWELVFQGGGPGRKAAEEMAARLGLRRCRWSGYAPEDQLLDSLMEADVLIATQKPETRGLLWPSKLALMKHLGLPLAWVGPPQGAVAMALRGLEVPVAVVAPGDSAGLAAWLAHLPPPAPRKPLNAIRLAVDEERRAGFDWWAQELRKAGS